MLKVTGQTHAKFFIFFRSEFVSGLLGFTNPPSRFSIYCTWTHVAILTVAMLYNFIVKAPQIRCRSNCKCCMVTAI